MEENWKTVAAALKASRLAMGLSQEELAERSGTSRSTIQNLEGGHQRRRISRKTHEITGILGWPDGYIDQILAGDADGPPVRRRQSATVDAEPKDDLPLAVAHELAHGDLLDTRVVELGDSDARMIVVVRAAEGASPEKIREALEQWRRVSQGLQIGDAAAG
ncbi:helix-turn-helix domain-containing protein [Streptomyces sp. cmx-4-9]|uniref:helix-turn-helix domain-containing protein n=1 Tax=Streptomyces sp. cmx-4-9 TaxID=2790941 RepID=UPI00397EF6BE